MAINITTQNMTQLSNRRYLPTGKLTVLWLQPLLSLCQIIFTIFLMKFPDRSGFAVLDHFIL